MDSECPALCLGNPEELRDYIIRWCGSIDEVQISVIDAISSEFEAVVLRFVKAYNVRNTEMLKYLQVVLRAVSALLGAWRVVNGTHEGYESIWDYPVQISVLHLFIVLILLVIEIAELVPSVADCYFQTLKTVEYRTLIGA